MNNPLAKDLHRAHQFLYYVEKQQVLTDVDFDAWEKYVYPDGGSPVGSDKKEDYSLEIQFLAYYLLLNKTRKPATLKQSELF